MLQICDWSAALDEIEQYKKSSPDPNALLVKVQIAPIMERQARLAREWLLSANKHVNPISAEHEQRIQQQIAELRAELDHVCSSAHFYIYDFNEKLDPSIKLLKGSILSQGTNPTLLALVLRATFRSPTVMNTIKLPLAVRYHDRYQIKKILTEQGLEVNKQSADELTLDSRPMVYAAFWDDAGIVRELLRHGSDVHQLDHLILCEYCLMLEQRHTLSAKQLEPPRPWLEAEVRGQVAAHRNEWFRLQPVSATLFLEERDFVRAIVICLLVIRRSRSKFAKTNGTGSGYQSSRRSTPRTAAECRGSRCLTCKALTIRCLVFLVPTWQERARQMRLNCRPVACFGSFPCGTRPFDRRGRLELRLSWSRSRAPGQCLVDCCSF